MQLFSKDIKNYLQYDSYASLSNNELAQKYKSHSHRRLQSKTNMLK